MIGLIVSIFIFNLIAFKTNKRLTPAQIVQIWTFTAGFQLLFDMIVEFKYESYWYFEPGVEWMGLLPRTVLIPPVNIIFLNGYPYSKGILKKLAYMLLFVICILLYEKATMLPEPWGYFHYGSWKIWYSAIVDPILLLVLLGFYKWIIWLETKGIQKKHDSKKKSF
ncbi:hypothetical protein [Cytobacillus oceanisediminis]|uniref:Uncharacterized protein n=1 Tax=Cytobacillus oceanisediminis TaxID=665099 RepID=A0A562K7J3_9BACI|nr:hypothetical protein [Cytobacillus oceanisediminis]TWH91204.1 hypothetical protein IQ19_00660 [Cytobacillus oceanisediminis]